MDIIGTSALASPPPNIPLGVLLGTSKYYSYAYNTLLYVFRYLSKDELLNCLQVCEVWKEIANEQTLWNNLNVYSGLSDAEELLQTPYGTKIRNLHLTFDTNIISNTIGSRLKKLNRLFLYNCLVVSDDKIVTLVETSKQLKQLKEFHISILLQPHHLEFIGNFENLTHLDLIIMPAGLNSYTNSACGFLKKLKNLQHLGLILCKDFPDYFWKDVASVNTLKSLKLSCAKWIDVLFGSNFLILNLKLLKKLHLADMRLSCIQLYDVFDRIKKLPNLKELVLDKICIESAESQFSNLLSQCQNLESLTISISHMDERKLPREIIKDFYALQYSEIVKGVLSLNKNLKYFCWSIKAHELDKESDVILRKDAIPFNNFKIVTKRQIKSYVDTHTNKRYVTIGCILKALQENLPNTNIQILTLREIIKDTKRRKLC